MDSTREKPRMNDTQMAAPSTPIAARRRGAVGWAIALAFLIVPLLFLGGAIYYFRFIYTGTYDIASAGTQAAYVAIALVTAGWLIFFTGLRWRTRFLLAGLGVLLLVGLGFRFQTGRLYGRYGLTFCLVVAEPGRYVASRPQGQYRGIEARRDDSSRRLPAIPGAGSGRRRPWRGIGPRLDGPSAAREFGASRSAPAGAPSPWRETWRLRRSNAAQRNSSSRGIGRRAKRFGRTAT